MKVKDLRVMGRATQGVRLINLREEDNIGAVAKVDADDEEDGSSEQPLNEGGEVQPQAEGDENNGKEIDNDGEETKNPE
jgi:DNA gyrase subunit A